MTRHYDSHDAGPEWGTPKHVWKPLADALGGFDLDPASGAEPEPIATDRLTVEDDGLAHDWYGDVWLNPPYGRSFNREWAEYAVGQARSPRVESLTALVPASTDTQWFQQNYAEGDLFTFIEGRLQFHGAGDNSASFSNVIVTFGSVNHAYIEALHELGFVLQRLR